MTNEMTFLASLRFCLLILRVLLSAAYEQNNTSSKSRFLGLELSKLAILTKQANNASGISSMAIEALRDRGTLGYGKIGLLVDL